MLSVSCSEIPVSFASTQRSVAWCATTKTCLPSDSSWRISLTTGSTLVSRSRYDSPPGYLMCLCACMYVCMYVCIYTHIYIHMCSCMEVCIYACMTLLLGTWCVCVHVCMHVCICEWICVCGSGQFIHKQIHIFIIRAYIHTNVNTAMAVLCVHEYVYILCLYICMNYIYMLYVCMYVYIYIYS
jgi:hypothetical protein